MNIVQFLPYFPPHKGGLETQAQEFSKFYFQKGCGKVFNIISDFDQDEVLKNPETEKIVFEGETIGYRKDGTENLVVPSIEIIPNFPVYKIWSRRYGLIQKYLKDKGINLVITRTRFFLTSFCGYRYAKKNKLKFFHIEHGSEYVQLSSRFKTRVSKIYDKTLGKHILRKADNVAGVSQACRSFIQNKLVNRGVEVVYRGIDINVQTLPQVEDLKENFLGKLIIGFVGRLYKWKNVQSLIKAYYELGDTIRQQVQIVVVGGGEDLQRLQELDIYEQVYFTGGRQPGEALALQKQFDVFFHTSSPGGGLASTLLQAMYMGNLIVATPYEGADEVIKDGENGILLKDDRVEKFKEGIENALRSQEQKQSRAEINQNIINERFNRDNNIKRYYELFQKL